MTNQEFFDTWSRWGDFPIEIETAKLSIFRGIRNNLGNERIQQIINWDKPRITDYYDEAGYCDLCEKVMNNFSQFDSTSSSTNHEMYGFVSDAVLFLADQNKELQKQIKLDQIKRLQKEITKLEGEIIDERGKK